MRIVLPWKQNHLFQTRNFDIPVRLFVYAVLHNHYQAIILMFSIKFVLILMWVGQIIGLEARKNLLNSEIKLPQHL